MVLTIASHQLGMQSIQRFYSFPLLHCLRNSHQALLCTRDVFERLTNEGKLVCFAYVFVCVSLQTASYLCLLILASAFRILSLNKRRMPAVAGVYRELLFGSVSTFIAIMQSLSLLNFHASWAFAARSKLHNAKLHGQKGDIAPLLCSKWQQTHKYYWFLVGCPTKSLINESIPQLDCRKISFPWKLTMRSHHPSAESIHV